VALLKEVLEGRRGRKGRRKKAKAKRVQVQYTGNTFEELTDMTHQPNAVGKE